ncbi:MAG: hypothetical protein AB7S80_18090, partial [Rhizobiaceae bacterium]
MAILLEIRMGPIVEKPSFRQSHKDALEPEAVPILEFGVLLRTPSGDRLHSSNIYSMHIRRNVAAIEGARLD